MKMIAIALSSRGKSGQHRAIHHLTGGSWIYSRTASATENNRFSFEKSKGENVR